jgi:hypothetical protein
MFMAVIAAGCGGEPAGSSPTASFPADPFQVLTSVGAQFLVALRAAPEQPPALGINTIQYQVTDQMGAPVTGLAITVMPWMPAHGHGGSVRPTVIEQGGGVYEAANVVLFMPGRWELRTTLAGGNTPEDSVTPSFDVH